METMYIQCKLKKENVEEISWIPEKFAIKGKIIGIKLSDKTWNEGWTVEEAYIDHVVSESTVIQERDAHKYHRNNTDI